MNHINPYDIITWHTKRQKVEDSPVIRQVYDEFGIVMWQCYCKEDGISGIGITPSDAHADWKARTIIVEKAST